MHGEATVTADVFSLIPVHALILAHSSPLTFTPTLSLRYSSIVVLSLRSERTRVNKVECMDKKKLVLFF